MNKRLVCLTLSILMLLTCVFASCTPQTKDPAAEGETVERAVADFISGMTDRYAIEAYQERFVPRVWRGLHE